MHDRQDAGVGDYCHLHVMHIGMKIVSKTPKCEFLSKRMDQFKALRKQLGGNKIVTQEIAGSVHLENYALECFCAQTMKIAPVVFTRSSPSILQILNSCHDSLWRTH